MYTDLTAKTTQKEQTYTTDSNAQKEYTYTTDYTTDYTAQKDETSN